jgi:hypothetical protein
MGRAFDCRCNDCGREFKVVQGGGFSFIHVCCDGCGDTQSVPRFAPPSPRVPAIASALHGIGAVLQSLAPGHGAASDGVVDLSEAQIRAYLSERPWPRQGDDWSPKQWQTLLAVLGACPCGGHWVEPESTPTGKPHALHRCPHCRSESFMYRFPDIVFD